MIIIDATDLILGRLSSFAAKQAKLGEDVVVVNCEKAVITGKRKEIIAHYVQKRERRTIRKGPFIHRGADRIVRRTIRGMTNYKRGVGRDAFSRVMCYIGVPDDFKGKSFTTVNGAHVSKTTSKYTTVGEISKLIGVKK